MATGRGRGFSQEDLDIRKIIEEAQTRWLKPPEVVEILRNYAAYGFKLNPVPPNTPPSGSLFLFDRKTLRYFRKDGHNWRKKKDGKTVREAHERLKAGSIDVLHCYYAHGEEDPSFQRRSYWMLEGAYEHIVLVHYLQVQGHRMGMHRQQESSTVPPVTGYYPPAVENASMLSPEIGSVSSELDDVDSSDDVEEIQPPQQAPTKSQPSLLHQLSKDWSSIYAETQQPNAPTQSLDDDIDLNDLLDNPDKFLGQKPLTPAVSLDNSGWSEILRECQTNESNLPNNVPTIPESNLPNVTVKQEFSWQDTLDQCTTPTTRQALLGQINAPSPRGIMDILSPRGLGREPRTVLEAQLRAATAENALKSMQTNSPTKRGVSPQMDVDRASQQQSWNAFPQPTQTWQQQEYGINTDSPSGYSVPQNVVPSPGMKDAKAVQNLKPQDSFGRWIAEQIGEESPSVLLAPTHSDSGSFWMADTENSTAEMQLNVSVTLSQVQRFSITDFSPDWTFCDEEVKVLVSGTFLDTVTNPWDFNWCCMFGDVEVPAEIINVGVLRCKVPKHSPGRIPFYVTCSDRLACSEVREFEIRPRQEKAATGTDNKIGQLEKELVLQVRFAKFLLSASTEDSKEKLDSDIEEWKSLEEDIKARVLGPLATKEKLLELTFKDNLWRWLSARESASVLDAHGQGLLHLASALGYDWAVKPILDAGVVANFRDSRGWTALHWAAAFGREKTVVALLAAGTSPDLVTDPTAKHPNGLMPSDLAAASGHKGIAGYLAEKALTRHLSSLTIADSNLNEISSISATLAGDDAAQSISTTSYQRNDGRLALQRSLSAVRNATKAAALIHSAYRVDSFRKKNIEDEGGHDEYGMTAEEIQSMVAAQRIQRPGHRDKMVHSAALQIQRKFRGWKGRKDFLTLRKNVVKIQAHVRGHQVRKNFRKLLRVVSVIEKAVLRWRRKRVGLRGFSRPDNTNGVNSDDDDFLKEARKQKEIALEKAVTRVQSMARSEEGREQYIRMLEGSRQAEEDYGRGGTKLEEDQVMTSAE